MFSGITMAGVLIKCIKRTLPVFPAQPLIPGVIVLLLITFLTCYTSSPYARITVPENCKGNFTVKCALDSLNQIEKRAAQDPGQKTVENYLNIVMNTTTLVRNSTTDLTGLTSYGNAVLAVTEKLVSALVRKTDTIKSTKISLQSLEIWLLMFGKNASVNKIPSLLTTTASMDIDLTGISKNTSAAVAFMKYTNMAAILEPRFFHTLVDTTKTMMSAVVSATLLQANDTNFTTFTFIFKHLHKLDPDGVLSCVHWNKSKWVKGGCRITDTNSTHTVCSCDCQGTSALIMQTYPHLNYNFRTIFHIACVAVGLMFLIFTILTLAVCRPYTNVTNATLLNLCISLLLSRLLIQVTQKFKPYICLRQQSFVVLEGVLLFLRLSAIMWMYIEAVLLFIFVKNLSKVRSNQGEWLSWKCLTVIGYFIPLVLVVVYALAFPGIYTDCRMNVSHRVKLIFNIPFFCILALNLLLFIIMLIVMISTLIRLKNENLQRSNDNDKKLIISVMLKSLAQFFILGCCRVILFKMDHNVIVYELFEFLSSQQGTFIFLVHCLLSHKVRQQYRKFLCAFCRSNKRNTARADVQVIQGAA